jgi:hypothetical protein
MADALRRFADIDDVDGGLLVRHWIELAPQPVFDRDVMGVNGGALEESWPRVFRRAKYTKSRERPGGDVEWGRHPASRPSTFGRRAISLDGLATQLSHSPLLGMR